jgi:hypothetical protein
MYLPLLVASSAAVERSDAMTLHNLALCSRVCAGRPDATSPQTRADCIEARCCVSVCRRLASREAEFRYPVKHRPGSPAVHARTSKCQVLQQSRWHVCLNSVWLRDFCSSLMTVGYAAAPARDMHAENSGRLALILVACCRGSEPILCWHSGSQTPSWCVDVPMPEFCEPRLTCTSSQRR